MLYLQLQKFFQKICTNCSRKTKFTEIKTQKTQTMNSLPTMDRTSNGRKKFPVNFKTDIDKQFEFWRAPLPNQCIPEELGNWSKTDRKPYTHGKLSVFFELDWRFFQALYCTVWKHCSKIKHISSTLDVSFVWSTFWDYVGIEASFLHQNARENIFWSACCFWDDRLSLC